MKLLRFKDNTYTWISSQGATKPESESEVIATGLWDYKIPISETKLAIRYMKDGSFDVATFGDFEKVFIFAIKQVEPVFK